MKAIEILALCALSIVASGLCAQSDWKLHKEREGVQIFFREAEDSPIKELKLKGRMEGSLSAITAMLSDIENSCSWLEKCINVHLIEKRSGNEYTFYQLIDFPWPYSDREFIMRTRITQDPASHVVHFFTTAVPDAYPEGKENFRVRKSESRWKISPDSPGFIRFEYQLKTDPGDKLPAWLVNMALDKGPMKTIRFMKGALKSEPYASRRVEFIKEPAK